MTVKLHEMLRIKLRKSEGDESDGSNLISDQTISRKLSECRMKTMVQCCLESLCNLRKSVKFDGENPEHELLTNQLFMFHCISMESLTMTVVFTRHAIFPLL